MEKIERAEAKPFPAFALYLSLILSALQLLATIAGVVAVAFILGQYSEALSSKADGARLLALEVRLDVELKRIDDRSDGERGRIDQELTKLWQLIETNELRIIKVERLAEPEE